MNRTRLLLLALCAALTFGGTFTCKSNNDSGNFSENPQTPAK
ncbi:MAG TPA: hypothetical protein VER17_03795 [Tepidisphaeraceae bacterium]|nr:hypothetical protein [Tepidisphaeraceae bacterium]